MLSNCPTGRAGPSEILTAQLGTGRVHDANYPLITPDGSAVIATVSRGSFTFALAEFAVRGKARRLLTPPVRNPAQVCGPLWTDASGAGLLTGCGDNSEYEIQNLHLTKLPSPWHLPTYNVPGAPAIAW